MLFHSRFSLTHNGMVEDSVANSRTKDSFDYSYSSFLSDSLKSREIKDALGHKARKQLTLPSIPSYIEHMTQERAGRQRTLG